MAVIMKMTLLALVAVYATVSPVTADEEGISTRFSLSWFGNAFKCLIAFTPTREELDEAQGILVECVASSISLQSILELIFGNLRRKRRSVDDNSNVIIDLTKLPSPGVVYRELMNRGYEDDLIKLRNCVAGKLNLLNADGVTFDTAALQVIIMEKVDGLSVQANTQLGVDECGEVENFDIGKYMICISAYCATGRRNPF